jgi:hypothetical protein
MNSVIGKTILGTALTVSTQVAIHLATHSVAHASLESVQKEMNAFQAPLEKSLTRALMADARYQKYQSEMSVALREPDLKLRTRKVIAIDNKYEPVFADAMKAAKINPLSIQKMAETLMKKYSKSGKAIKIAAGKYLTWAAWVERQQQAEQPPAETEVTFQAPFSFEHSSQEGDLLIRTNLETGRLTAITSRAFAGHHVNRAGVGDFVRIPWATGRVRVSARLPEVSGSLTAFAGLGGSGTKAFSVIDVLTEDGERCREEFEHAVAIAPVVWRSELQYNDVSIMACEMAAPPSGQDIAVRFQVGADATAGGAAFAVGSAGATPSPIRIRLIQ